MCLLVGCQRVASYPCPCKAALVRRNGLYSNKDIKTGGGNVERAQRGKKSCVGFDREALHIWMKLSINK